MTSVPNGSDGSLSPDALLSQMIHRSRWITTLTLLALAIVAVLLTGCSDWSSSHDYNAPAPKRVIVPVWTRVEDPGNFPSILRACVSGDGVYIDQGDTSSPEVIIHDPGCVGA